MHGRDAVDSPGQAAFGAKFLNLIWKYSRICKTACLLPYVEFSNANDFNSVAQLNCRGFAERAPCLAKDYAVPGGTPRDVFEIMGKTLHISSAA